MRKSLSDAGVAALKSRAVRYSFPDPELRGHYVRVQPGGRKSYVAVTRDSSTGKQVWTTIGPVDLMGIEQARTRAREVILRVQAGQPAVEPKAVTFAQVVADWRVRHLERNGLRAAREINRLLNVHILPAWGSREFVSIRRSDVAALLDRVEDGHGSRSADYCLTITRSIMNWQAARAHDDYTPPIVRGMRRQLPSEHERSRVLDDDEIRRVWTACEELGNYGALIRMLLLTTQRLEKVLTMAWADIDAGGVWRIPTVSKREKPHGGELRLPQLARDLLAAIPVIEGNPFVFAGRGQGHSNGHSKNKARLDRSSGVTDWVVHDLRRTGRSLLSRAGVRPDIAERTLGHAQPRVAQTYDRHLYVDEKGAALAKLAALIDSIVNPRDTVVPMRPAMVPMRPAKKIRR
jgi:integrase